MSATNKGANVCEEIQQTTELPQHTSPIKTGKRKPEDSIDLGKENDEPRFKRHKTGHESSTESVPIFIAPVSWTADAEVDGKALLVDDKSCIFGTCDGRIVELSHSGEEIRHFRLQPEVGAVMREGDSLYAWCHSKNSYQTAKGTLFDLTSDVPRVLFSLDNFGDKVLHAAMIHGCLAVGDDKGNVALLGCAGKILWQTKPKDGEVLGDGNFFEADKTGIYVAHKRMLCCYDVKNGDVIWSFEAAKKRNATIENGTMDEQSVYIVVDGKVLRVSKESGKQMAEYVPARHKAAGVCIGNGLLITGSCPTVLFDLDTAKECYRMNFPGRLWDSAVSFHASRKLFVFWDKLYCVDLTAYGIERALGGTSTRTMERALTKEPVYLESSTSVTRANTLDGGFLVECVQEDGELVAKPTSAGYNDEWNVCMPRDLIRAGRRYAVQKLFKSELGCFYRAAGTIKLLNVYDNDDVMETEKDGVLTGSDPALLSETCHKAVVTKGENDVVPTEDNESATTTTTRIEPINEAMKARGTEESSVIETETESAKDAGNQ